MTTEIASKTNNYLYNPKLKNFARQLRNEMTKSEVCLWNYLLKGKGLGYSFKRQRPIDNFIVDFVCLELMLVIELDGASHHSEEAYLKDVRKESLLTEVGFTVLRFEDELVLNHLEIVHAEIENWIENSKS